MKIKTTALLAAAGLALAACESKPEEQPAAETNVTDLAVEPAEVSTEAPPATRIDNTADMTTPPAATLTADEQTVEDADATGMTARVDRSQPDNSAQPAR